MVGFRIPMDRIITEMRKKVSNCDRTFIENLGPMAKREHLSEWRKSVLRFTQAEMAAKLGVDPGMYRMYEYRPDSPLPADLLAKLIEMGFKPIESDLPKRGLQVLIPQSEGIIKFAGVATAGHGMSQPLTAASGMHVPIEFASEDHSGVLAEGDSMMPFIHSGDSLVFRDSPELKNRMPVCAYFDGDDAPVVKELHYVEGKWVLKSWNPSYPDRDLQGATIRGFLIGMISASGALKIGPEMSGLTRSRLEEVLRSRLF